MKGIVEVYGQRGDELVLLHQDHNMIVDGAGETLVDLFTTPSSFQSAGGAGFGDDQTHRLDSSNYTVQAISFGKGSLGYLTNAYQFTHRNLLSQSENFTGSDWVNTAATVTTVTGYTAFDLSSGATLLVDDSSSVSKLAGQIIGTYGNSIGWMTASIDLKYNFENPPAIASSVGDTNYRWTMFKFQQGSPSNEKKLYISWNESTGEASLATELGSTYTKGYLKTLGNGWYRAAIPLNFSGTGSKIFSVYPNAADNSIVEGGVAATLMGSVYAARPMINIGSIPLDYIPQVDSITRSNFDVSGLANNLNFYLLSGTGTFTNSPAAALPTSSYGVIANKPSIPNPQHTQLESGIETYVESISDVRMNYGHNLNVIGHASSTYCEIDDISTWQKGSVDFSGIGTGGAYLLGAYAPSGGITMNIVSAISETAFNNPIYSQYLNGGINKARTMNVSGYGYASYALLGESADTSGRLVVSAAPDFSSTGEITYQFTIPSGDVGTLNAFGGVFEIGLWTFDYKGSVESGLNPPPFSKNVDNTGNKQFRNKFRLFAKKTFNDDITASRGYVVLPGPSLYDNLYIIWRIKLI